jgi:choline dehydrogenase
LSLFKKSKYDTLPLTLLPLASAQKGQLHQIRATKEVILSGGAINTPQLLMLSGVGDANDLKPLGIDVVQHLPGKSSSISIPWTSAMKRFFLADAQPMPAGVGANLQDHLDLYVQYECTQPVTLYHASWRFPHNMAYIGLRWLLTQSGWGASAHLEAGGFVRRYGSSIHHTGAVSLVAI